MTLGHIDFTLLLLHCSIHSMVLPSSKLLFYIIVKYNIIVSVPALIQPAHPSLTILEQLKTVSDTYKNEVGLFFHSIKPAINTPQISQL